MLYPFKIYVKAKTGNTDLCSWQLQGAEILIDFFGSENINIARGTTDPGYSILNLSYLSIKIECYLHWLKIWPPDGATCISCKFGHQMAPLALFIKIWLLDGTTWISSKFGHQMAPLASLVLHNMTR